MTYYQEEAEIDEQWSFVGNKSNQRWLWYAIDHETNTYTQTLSDCFKMFFLKF